MFSPTPSREHERHGDTHPMTAPKFRPLTFGVTRVVVRDGAPGVRYLKAEQALKEHPARLTDRLKHWADTAPERTFMARRVKRADGSSGDWRHVTYGEAWASARAIAQGLINRGLSAERPVVILSENDLEHALLALGCLVAGVPYVPTSPPTRWSAPTSPNCATCSRR
jgi:feruloyl-CoA synthase